jgi:hypothetical protein
MVGNPKGPITSGVDKNFFDRLTVTNTDFNNIADVICQFKGAHKFLNMLNEDAVVIEYSFNGNTVHGDLAISGSPGEEVEFPARVFSKIWFRVAAGTGTVRVEAYAL